MAHYTVTVNTSRELVLKPMFQRIGDHAARGLVAALDGEVVTS